MNRQENSDQSAPTSLEKLDGNGEASGGRYNPGDLALLVAHRLDEALGSGHPPLHPEAWMRQVQAAELAIEARRPGWIAKAAAGIRASAQGRKITGWREVRGTHAFDHVRDPAGTDRPPW